MSRRSRPLRSFAALALIALAAAGCGAGGSGETAPPPDYATLLAGSPPPLAQLHSEADQLLDGGLGAYEARLAELSGFPVLANVWASWCNPCRMEFGALQKASAKFGKRVAFLGVDSQDDDDAAATFLRDHPVPYPSYLDHDEAIANSLGGRGLPRTAFYDSEGRLCFLKIGPYADEAELEADIRRYALRGECELG